MINFGKHYDWKFAQRLFSKLVKTKPRVLDVGCGSGEKSLLFLDKVESFVGLDASVTEVEKAKKKGIKAVVGDAQELPFPENSFEVVLAFHLIEHLEDPLMFLRESYRVLTPGGYLLLITPNKNRWTSKITRIIFKNSKYKYPMNPDHIFEFNSLDFKKILSRTKFSSFQIISLFLGASMSIFGTAFDFGCLFPPYFLEKWCSQYAAWARK